MSILVEQDYLLYDVINYEIVADYMVKLIFDDGTEQVINEVVVA